MVTQRAANVSGTRVYDARTTAVGTDLTTISARRTRPGTWRTGSSIRATIAACLSRLSTRPAPKCLYSTPAGRFVAALGRNAHEKEILWVDHDLAVSMHPVITTNPKEHRLHRLNTPTPQDNRISYGCINVPAKFFDKVVRPAFTGTNGIVYVLPETRSAREVFASYDVEEQAQLQTATKSVPVSVASAAARH